MLSRIFHLTGYTERLSAQSYSPSAAQDADFQQKCATALNDFQLDVLGIKEILQTAGADRGLAFYDRTACLRRDRSPRHWLPLVSVATYLIT